MEPELRPARNSSGVFHAWNVAPGATPSRSPLAIAWATTIEGVAPGPQNTSGSCARSKAGANSAEPVAMAVPARKVRRFNIWISRAGVVKGTGRRIALVSRYDAGAQRHDTGAVLAAVEGQTKPETLGDAFRPVDKQRRRGRQAQLLHRLPEQRQPTHKVRIAQFGDRHMFGHWPTVIAARAEQQRRPKVIHLAQMNWPTRGRDMGVEHWSNQWIDPDLGIERIDNPRDAGFIQTRRRNLARHRRMYRLAEISSGDSNHRLAGRYLLGLSGRGFRKELDVKAH